MMGNGAGGIPPRRTSVVGWGRPGCGGPLPAELTCPGPRGRESSGARGEDAGGREGARGPGWGGEAAVAAAGGRAEPDSAPPVVAAPPAVGTGTSLALSSLLSLLLFAGMQMYSRQLASTEWLTIQGGLLGSGLFVFSLTVSFLRGGGRGEEAAARLCRVSRPTLNSLGPGLQQPGESGLWQRIPSQDLPRE